MPVFRLRRRILFSLAMAGIVLGTAEILVRVLAREALEQADSPPPPAQEGAPNLVGNPYLLFEMAPGDRFENGTHIAVNRLGLRGPEWTSEKSPSVRRILALGDSSVYGFGVADGEVFTARLDDALGAQVEVINAAVPGYSTYQTINLLEIRALALRPDLVLVGCLWSDNNFDSFVDRDLLAAYSSFRNRRARAIKEGLQTSALYRLLDYKLRVLRQFPAERRVGWMVGRGEKIGERRVSIREYAHNLETIVELVHERGAEVLFMVLPNREDIERAYVSGAAWDPYRLVMRDAAVRHGAPLLDLPALFAASGSAGADLFLDEMHPTADGHALWAGALLDLLRECGWLDGRPVERDAMPGPIPTYEDPFVGGSHAPADAAQNPPVPAEQPLQAGVVRPRVRGTLVVPETLRDLPLQIDAVVTDGGTTRVIGTAQVSASGPFELLLNEAVARLVFEVYVDREGDGPSAGDPRFRLYPDGVQVPGDAPLEGVVLDLAQGQAQPALAEGATQAEQAVDGPARPPPQDGRLQAPLVTDQVPGSAHTTPDQAARVTDQVPTGSER